MVLDFHNLAFNNPSCGYNLRYPASVRRVIETSWLCFSDSILITAAAGAVGLATLDVAKNVYNAEIIGAVGGLEKCQLIESLGAKAVDYK